MDADRFMSRLNPLVIGLLQSPLHFLASGGLMTLRYTGRRSGRTITIPVGYQMHAGRIDILVSKADRKRWWRNFGTPGQVELCIRGKRASGTAHLVAPATPAFRTAFERTFERLPFLPSQFGIADFTKGVPLDSGQLALLAEHARLVSVVLDGAPPDV